MQIFLAVFREAGGTLADVRMNLARKRCSAETARGCESLEELNAITQVFIRNFSCLKNSRDCCK